jgi:hypothetical protein
LAEVGRALRVGVCGPGDVPVFFCAPRDADGLVADVEGITCAERGPFILATPTAAAYSARLEQMQAGGNFLLLPLSHWLRLGARGRLELVRPIDGVLQAFWKRCAEGLALAGVVERIDRNIEAVASGNFALRQENEELRTLQKEGFFKFALKVDGEDFQAFAIIMALGTRKAAADFLKVPHRSFS